MNEKVMKNLNTLLGDPRKAIIKLSIPMMIGNLVQTLYNVVDGAWVAGLGADSLAAVGLFMPFMMILSALAMGIGIGGSSAISRAIGAGDRARAGNAASHTLVGGMLIGMAVAFSMFPFLETIFLTMGASSSIASLAAGYGRIIILGSPLLFISSLGNAILRGEGDARRAMYLMMASAIMNMVLDPIFIYYLHLGVNGAAMATVISIAFSSFVVIYWLFFKKDTYVQFSMRHFAHDWKMTKEILRVGIPSSLAQITMSLTMIILSAIVIMAGGDYGMAVFSGGWRIVMLAVVPLFGIASSVISVTGAAYGARDAEKLKAAYLYAVKVGTLIGLATGIIIGIFAPQLSYIFAYSSDSSSLGKGIVEFLRYVVFYFPGMAAGMLTSSMFRGIGKGSYSLAITLLRAFGFQIVFAYLFGIVLSYGLGGVWMGVVIANITASSIAMIWGLRVIKAIERKWMVS
ncbi:MAG: MATE family efflux transporter [Thermoplasmata archaeon]|nr:MATE family efflux transporter [Thermoplasmata archaeon]